VAVLGFDLLDWNAGLSAGELGVTIGTLTLAGFTARLGTWTRRSAKAAQEAVDETEEPFVIATPTDDPRAIHLRPHEIPPNPTPPLTIHRAEDTEDGVYFVRLKLWNIGSGPAIIRAISLSSDDGASYLDSPAAFHPVGTGQAADIEVSAPRWPSASPAAAKLTIQYFRANGATYLTESDVVIEGSIVTCYTYRRSRPEREAASRRPRWFGRRRPS
jgi:hypothetical protein